MKISNFFMAICMATPAFAGVSNLLVNGSLENPLDAPNGSDLIDGWTLIEPDVDGAGASVNSASFESFANHTPGGDRGLWIRSFEGGQGGDEPFTVNPSLYQDVTAHAGNEYTLSAWFRFEANYASDHTFLSLQFFDAMMNELSMTSIDVNLLNELDSVWREFNVVAIADPGAMFVRARMDVIGGQLAPANPQSGFVDDFVLIPSPGGAALFALAGFTSRLRRRARIHKPAENGACDSKLRTRKTTLAHSQPAPIHPAREETETGFGIRF